MSNRIGLSFFVFVLLSVVGLLGQSEPQKPTSPPPPSKPSKDTQPDHAISDDRGGPPTDSKPSPGASAPRPDRADHHDGADHHHADHYETAPDLSFVVIRYFDEPSTATVTGDIISVDLKLKSFVLKERDGKGSSKITTYQVNDQTKINSYNNPEKPQGKPLMLSDLKPGQRVTIMHFPRNQESQQPPAPSPKPTPKSILDLGYIGPDRGGAAFIGRPKAKDKDLTERSLTSEKSSTKESRGIILYATYQGQIVAIDPKIKSLSVKDRGDEAPYFYLTDDQTQIVTSQQGNKIPREFSDLKVGDWVEVVYFHSLKGRIARTVDVPHQASDMPHP